MRAENYWKQFLSTGKIDDYLAYREVDLLGTGVTNRKGGRPDGDEGAINSAGADQCYRDDFTG